MLLLSFLVAISRVYLGYHTLEQVLVGGFIGIAWGLIYYSFSAMFLEQFLVDLKNSYYGKVLKLEWILSART